MNESHNWFNGFISTWDKITKHGQVVEISLSKTFLQHQRPKTRHFEHLYYCKWVIEEKVLGFSLRATWREPSLLYFEAFKSKIEKAPFMELLEFPTVFGLLLLSLSSQRVVSFLTLSCKRFHHNLGSDDRCQGPRLTNGTFSSIFYFGKVTRSITIGLPLRNDLVLAGSESSK